MSERTAVNDTPRTDPLRDRTTLIIVVLACSALCGMAAARSDAAPDVVADLRPLLVAAIDAPDGRAAGTLAGPLAEALRMRGVSGAPLLVEVTTLASHQQTGCKRLNVRFRQRDVKIGDAPPEDRELAFQLNYCRDGQPPRSLE